jgi:hypothetical protein
VIGDHAQDRVDASRKFQKEMAAIGGNVTVDVLPENGIFGNGHAMALEKNNKHNFRQRPRHGAGEKQQAYHVPHDRLARRQRTQGEIASGVEIAGTACGFRRRFIRATVAARLTQFGPTV